MRGFSYIPGSIGLECLLFPVNWFTRALRDSHSTASVVCQVEVEHMGAKFLWALDSTKEYQSLSPLLLDHMAVEAGLRNLHYLSAFLSDNEPAYRTFREAGYAPCAWHKVWQ